MRRFDHKRKIVDYLKRNLSKGYTEESLKWALIGQGYSRVIVEESIEETHQELAKEAPILKEKPVIKYEIIDESDQPIIIKRSWWKRLLGLQ